MTFIFGYGSLAHTPGFRYRQRVEGWIKGYRRVFWQGSTDHRGTPEAPGRTVTLAEEPGAKTWGVAFELDGDSEQVANAIKYLEWREKQYDVRKLVDVHSRDGRVLVAGALCYIATESPSNANWLGPAALPDIAAQVAVSAGPSGPNCDYVFKLADTMRAMGVEDEELFWLEAEVRRLVAERGEMNQGPSAQQHSADQYPQQQQQQQEQQQQQQRREQQEAAAAQQRIIDDVPSTAAGRGKQDGAVRAIALDAVSTTGMAAAQRDPAE